MMKQVEDRFGRVFVRQTSSSQESSANLTISSDYVLLENRKFSNFYLRPFLDNNVEDVSLAGRKYSVDVLGHRIRIPIPMGENVLLKTEDIETAFKKVLEALSTSGLVDSTNDKEKVNAVGKIIEDNGVHLCLALCANGRNVQELDVFTGVIITIFIDDILEGSVSKERLSDVKKSASEKPSYKLISQVGRIFSGAIEAAAYGGSASRQHNPQRLILDFMRKNKKITGDNVDVDKIKNSNDRYRTMLKAFRISLKACNSMIATALETSKGNGCSAKHMLQITATAIDYFCLEYSEEWNNLAMGGDKGQAMIPSMTYLRRHTVAGYATVETILLQYGVHVGENVRGTALFQMISYQFATWMLKCNDFISFEKELRSEGKGWQNNEACMLHKTMGLSPEESKATLVKDANRALDQIELLCSLLLNTWMGRPEMEQVTKFVNTLKFYITILIQGGTLAKRYNDNVVMDCYID